MVACKVSEYVSLVIDIKTYCILHTRSIFAIGIFKQKIDFLLSHPAPDNEIARNNKLTETKYRYDVALLYLEQAEYNLDTAIQAYKEDEQWEKDHPMEVHGKGKGKTKHNVGRRRFTGQNS